MSPTYKYLGDSTVIFSTVKLTDGSTLKAEPGGVYELLEDSGSSLLEKVADGVQAVVEAPEVETEETVEAPTESETEAPYDPSHDTNLVNAFDAVVEQGEALTPEQQADYDAAKERLTRNAA